MAWQRVRSHRLVRPHHSAWRTFRARRQARLRSLALSARSAGEHHGAAVARALESLLPNELAGSSSSSSSGALVPGEGKAAGGGAVADAAATAANASVGVGDVVGLDDAEVRHDAS